MIFTVQRLRHVTLLFLAFSFFSTTPTFAENDKEVCLNANLDAEQLASLPECATAPVLTCPSIYYGCPGESPDPSNTGYATAVAGDLNCPTPYVNFADEVVVNSSCTYEVHRTWTAEYPGNANPWLFADCTQIIYLADYYSPLIKNCPNDITVSMNANCEGIATWSDPVFTDNCGISSVSSNYSPGDVFPEGTTNVIYTVYDNCSQSSSCSFNVTVVGSCCTSNPSISCPADLTLCPGSSPNEYHPNVTGTATAQGGFDCGNPSVSYVDVVSAIASCPGGKRIERTWTASDPVNPNLSTSCIQIIELIDTEKPSLLNGTNSITVLTQDQSGTIVNFTNPTFQDNCGIASINQSHNSGFHFPLGCTNVTYSAFDHCGNFVNYQFNICVEMESCTQSPIIDCPPHQLLCPGTAPVYYHPNFTGYATATPGGINCGSPVVTYTDTVNPISSCQNGSQILRTWNAVDPDNPYTLINLCSDHHLNDYSGPLVSNCSYNINTEATDSYGASVSYNAPQFTDDCGLQTL